MQRAGSIGMYANNSLPCSPLFIQHRGIFGAHPKQPLAPKIMNDTRIQKAVQTSSMCRGSAVKRAGNYTVFLFFLPSLYHLSPNCLPSSPCSRTQSEAGKGQIVGVNSSMSGFQDAAVLLVFIMSHELILLFELDAIIIHHVSARPLVKFT